MVKNVPEVPKRILHRLQEGKFWGRALGKFSRLDSERFLPRMEVPELHLQKWARGPSSIPRPKEDGGSLEASGRLRPEVLLGLQG